MVRATCFALDDRQIGSLMVPRADVVCAWTYWSRSRKTCAASTSPNMRAFRWCAAACGEHPGRAQRAPMVVARGARASRAASWARWRCTALYVPRPSTPGAAGQLPPVRHAWPSSSTKLRRGAGIVTVQDLIEAITGEFQSLDPDDSWAVQRDDGSWLLDGHIPVPELRIACSWPPCRRRIAGAPRRSAAR